MSSIREITRYIFEAKDADGNKFVFILKSYKRHLNDIDWNLYDTSDTLVWDSDTSNQTYEIAVYNSASFLIKEGYTLT